MTLNIFSINQKKKLEMQIPAGKPKFVYVGKI